MKRKLIVWCVLVSALLVFLGACEVFTSSWAPWAARDLDAILPEVNGGNARDMVDQFADDPDKSLQILKKIAAAINKTSNEAEQAKLRAAALDAAVNASGIMDAFLGSMTDFLEEGEGDFDTVVELFESIKNTKGISAALVTAFDARTKENTAISVDSDTIANSADNAAQLLLSAMLITKNEIEIAVDEFEEGGLTLVNIKKITTDENKEGNLSIAINMVRAAGKKTSSIGNIIDYIPWE
jgi:hypothetical protein